MKKKYNLAVKTGEFQNGSGETKNRYQVIGAMIEGNNGPYLLIDKTFNPAGIQDGKSSVLISMFEPKMQAQSGGGYAGPSDDDIPF